VRAAVVLQNIMDEWLTCQGKWLYLEPIFSADEIMKQIPREGSAFRLMDASWRQIVQQVSWCLSVKLSAGQCKTVAV
jgi:dynein heavy chain